MKSNYKKQIEDFRELKYQEDLSILDETACESIGYYYGYED